MARRREEPRGRSWLAVVLAGLGIGLLTRALRAGLGKGSVFRRKGGGDGAAPVPEEERETCEPRFLFHRQDGQFYRRTTNGRVNRAHACDDPQALQVPERISIPIYWVVVGTQWTADAAKAKMDEAAAWFERFCIFLTLQPVALRRFEAAAIEAQLRAGDTGDPDVMAEACVAAYTALWGRVGRPQDLLMILFLDSFRAVRYVRAGPVNRVAGNFGKHPLILVPGDPDTRSRHIVTHELIHGLGKVRNETAEPPTTSVGGAGEDRINTWEEAGCTNDMGNAMRQNPGDPLNKDDSDLLDWASYHQFLARAKTIV